MTTLAIDIETFSSVDLKTCGVHRYVESPDFEILLFAFGIDNLPIVMLDLANFEDIPDEVMDALTDPTVIKTAWNASFELACIAKHLGIALDASQWECTMAKTSMLGLPLSLDACSKALSLTEQKDPFGGALIRYFSVPCKPTKANGMRTRNQPHHDRDRWTSYKRYGTQDVVVELAIRSKIAFFTIPEIEKRIWRLNQKTNSTGILVDSAFVRSAMRIDLACRDRMTAEAVTLTGLQNPNSLKQLKNWISEEVELLEFDKLTKDTIPGLLKGFDAPVVARVLELRLEMSKTSVKKYNTMRRYACTDNRARGLIQYYGANRTGRNAGRGIQVQNLPKNKLRDLDLARRLVAAGDGDGLEMLFGNVPDTLSQLIRTAFVASPGHRLLVGDLSAIEARVIAWLAGEKWRLDVFKTHGRIYEASGAAMFRVPIESITKTSPLRDKAKIAELALGFQGGPNALIKMGALKMGLTEEELPKLVAMWRNANKRICDYWNTIDNAAIECVSTGAPVTVGNIRFSIENRIMFIKLPSGRRLAYQQPSLRPNKFNSSSVIYMGMDQTTKKWGLQETYGGKLVENIVQATARDILMDGMLRVDAAGYNIVMDIHDELVSEMPNGEGSIEELCSIMAEPIAWARGLPLAAEGFETAYYKKD